MPIPSLNEWKLNNKERGINEYYRKYPEAKHQNLNQPIIIQSRNRSRGKGILKLVLFIATLIIAFNVVSIACLNQNVSQLEDDPKDVSIMLQKDSKFRAQNS